MSLLNCPWCHKLVPIVRGYRDSDPTFVYFMYCPCKSTDHEFRCDVDSSDNLVGFGLKISLNNNSVLLINASILEDEGYDILLLKRTIATQKLKSEKKIISPTEAMNILYKYKQLWAFS